MKKKNLLLLNLDGDIKVDRQFDYYIDLGNANFLSKNSKKISIREKFSGQNNYLKEKLVNSLKKKTQSINPIYFNFNELELFNLRNDKINNIDLIINILYIKSVIKKFNIKDIFLISNNIVSEKIILESFPKIKIIINKKSIIDNEQKIFPLLSITKFYLKTFIVITLAKIFNNSHFTNNNFKTACLSIAPIFFKKNKEIFFKKKKNLKLNFLLTDETHLNLTILDIIKNLKKKYFNLIHVEELISYKDLFLNLFKSYKNLNYIKKSNLNFYIDKINFSFFFREYLLISSINRSKLNIYNEVIPNIFRKFNLKNFEMYLFEYNFGFFVVNLIKNNFSKIIITGNQHGIFSDKLMWFNILQKNNKIKNFLPDKIISFNKNSLNDYKKILNRNDISFTYKRKSINKIAKNFKHHKNKNDKKCILVLTGTHDSDIIYRRLKKRVLQKNVNQFFYIKFHPKVKKFYPNFKNIKVIDSIKNKKFDFAIISSTSTLVYDFIKLKKKFMVIKIENKSNLISSSLENNLKFFEI